MQLNAFVKQGQKQNGQKRKETHWQQLLNPDCEKSQHCAMIVQFPNKRNSTCYRLCFTGYTVLVRSRGPLFDQKVQTWAILK